MTSGRSQMLATRNFGDWRTVVGEVPWSSMAKTTMDCHSTVRCVDQSVAAGPVSMQTRSLLVVDDVIILCNLTWVYGAYGIWTRLSLTLANNMCDARRVILQRNIMPMTRVTSYHSAVRLQVHTTLLAAAKKYRIISIGNIMYSDPMNC